MLCLSCNFGRHWNGGVCPAADEHLHLKFVRNIHPHDVGKATLHTDAKGGQVAFRIPYTLGGATKFGEPIRVHPLILNVQHNPPDPNPRVLADELLTFDPPLRMRDVEPGDQPDQVDRRLVRMKDVVGVSSSRDLPDPGESRVEKFGGKS